VVSRFERNRSYHSQLTKVAEMKRGEETMENIIVDIIAEKDKLLPLEARRPYLRSSPRIILVSDSMGGVL
jgi:hypothetical protein